MAIQLTPDEIAQATPVNPAESGPIRSNPAIQLSPDEIAQAQPAGFDTLKDFTAEQLADLTKQDPKFSIADAFVNRPDLQKDPAINQKIADAVHLTRQVGLVEGLKNKYQGANAIETNVNVTKAALGAAADVAKGFGKQIWNYAEGAATPILAAITSPFVDEATTAGMLDLGQRQIAENLAGTELASTETAGLAAKGAGYLARKAHVAKQLEDYTPEDKLKHLFDLMGELKQKQEITKGRGAVLSATGSHVIDDLAANGVPIRPEEVAELASGDPFSWYAMGKAFHGATSLVPKRVGVAVERGATALGEIGEKVVGKGLETAADITKLASKVGAKVAPTTGAIVGAVKGSAALSPIGGAAAGLLVGEKVAKVLGKTGALAEKISNIGEQVAGAPVTSAGAQLIKDIVYSAPGGAVELGKGAAFDLGLAAVTSEETPEERAGVGLGTVFGGIGAAKRMGLRALSGQIIAPRGYAGPGRDVPALPGSKKDLLPLVQVHSEATKDLAPGDALRVNALRAFAQGIVDPSGKETDLFHFTNPAKMQEALEQLGVSSEQAKLLSEQEGFFTTDINGKRVIGVRNIDAAPHESFHAFQDVIGEAANQQLDSMVKQAFGPVWEREGVRYADRIPGLTDPAQWREHVLDRTKSGIAAAAEKIAQNVFNKLSHDTGAVPDPAAVKQLAEGEMARLLADAQKRNPNLSLTQLQERMWRDVLSPQEAQAAGDKYLARELAAENFDAVFKHTGPTLEQPPGLLPKFARVVANVVSAMGGNPLEGRVSQIGEQPLNFQIAEAVRNAAKGAAKPVIEPAKAKTIAPRATPGTPERRQQDAEEAQAHAEAAPDVKPAPTAEIPNPQSPREVLGVAAEAIAQGTGVKINYHSAPNEPAAAITSNREARRSIIEAFRTMPQAARALWEKTFFPDRVEKRATKFQLWGWAPEVFASNAHKVAQVLNKLPGFQSPYELDPKTGSFTEAGWKELYGDTQKYVANQTGGWTGAGEDLVVPKLPGIHAPPEVGAPVPLDQTKADFINLLFGQPLPKTARIKAGEMPRNIVGQEISAATKPGRIEVPFRQKPSFEGEKAEALGIEGRPIMEVNPLRNQLEKAAAAAGIEMPSLIEANQRLNVENIADIQHAPEAPEFRGNTITIAAGLQPKSGHEAMQQLKDMSPDELRDFKGKFGGGGTAWALEVGAAAKTQDDLQSFREMRGVFESMRKDAMSQKDYAKAMDFGLRGQLAREAFETATGRQIDDMSKEAGTFGLPDDFKFPLAPKEAAAALQPQGRDYFTTEKDVEDDLTRERGGVNPGPAWDIIEADLDRARKDDKKLGGLMRNSSLKRPQDMSNALAWYIREKLGLEPGPSTLPPNWKKIGEHIEANHPEIYGLAESRIDTGSQGSASQNQRAGFATRKLIDRGMDPQTAQEVVKDPQSWADHRDDEAVDPGLRDWIDARIFPQQASEGRFQAQPGKREEMPGREFWMDRSGNIINARGGHYNAAREVLEAAGEKAASFPYDSYVQMHKLGYVRLVKEGNRELLANGPDLTPAQRRKLDEISFDHGLDVFKDGEPLDVGAVAQLQPGKNPVAPGEPRAGDYADKEKFVTDYVAYRDAGALGTNQRQLDFYNAMANTRWKEKTDADTAKQFSGEQEAYKNKVSQEEFKKQYHMPGEVVPMVPPTGNPMEHPSATTSAWVMPDGKAYEVDEMGGVSKEYHDDYAAGFSEFETGKHPNDSNDFQAKAGAMRVAVRNSYRSIRDYGDGELGISVSRKPTPSQLAHVREMLSETAEDSSEPAIGNIGVDITDALGNVRVSKSFQNLGKITAGQIARFLNDPAFPAEPSAIPQSAGEQFQPATAAGRKLEEQGYRIERQDHFGSGMMTYLLHDPNGKVVSELGVSQLDTTSAHVDMVHTAGGDRYKGFAETLYRELATDLQKKGITKLEGQVASLGTARIRQKLFGNEVPLDEIYTAPTGEQRLDTHMESEIRPDAQFQPRTEERRPVEGESEDAAAARRYFSLGHEGPGDKTWMWHPTQNYIAQAPGDTSHNRAFGERAEKTYRGRFDSEQNTVSVVFPAHVTDRLEHPPTADDLPNKVYDAIKEDFGADVKIVAFQPKKSEDWELKPASGGFSKAWILPDGTPVQLGNQWHHDYLNENPDLQKQYGLKPSEDADVARTAALKKGFARMNYDTRNGMLTVEAREADWPTIAPAVKQFVETNIKKVDRVRVYQYNKGVTQISDSATADLFNLPKEARSAAIPFIGTPGDVTETSPQARGYQYLPPSKKELEKVRDEGGGQTFTAAGQIWKPEGKQDIVTLASVNVPQEELSPAAFKQAVEPYKKLLKQPGIVTGVFAFEKDGKPTVSIDVNAVVPQEHRENTLAFAKQNDQDSIWDAVKQEAVSAGGKGNTVLINPDEMLKAAKSLVQGKPVDFDLLKTPADTTNMSSQELAEHYPEAVIPDDPEAAMGSKIVESPRYKEAGSLEKAVDSFGDELVKFAKEHQDQEYFIEGAKWYSDFSKALHAEFGDDAGLFAEFLAATSPQTSVVPNFQFAYDAMLSYKAGRFKKILPKFEEGLKKIDDGSWEEWYLQQVKEGNVEKPPKNYSSATFLAHWIDHFNLRPRQSNGKMYGMHTAAVLQVLARRWLDLAKGLKTKNFVANLFGSSHEATIDLWADRTMRRLGYEGYQDRWRILPKNGSGVVDADFEFSQKAFANAAAKLGMKPDALQGALWFAEKILWAKKGWGALDLGSFMNEVPKMPAKRAQFAENQKTAAGGLVEPRNITGAQLQPTEFPKGLSATREGDRVQFTFDPGLPGKVPPGYRFSKEWDDPHTKKREAHSFGRHSTPTTEGAESFIQRTKAQYKDAGWKINEL